MEELQGQNIQEAQVLSAVILILSILTQQAKTVCTHDGFGCSQLIYIKHHPNKFLSRSFYWSDLILREYDFLKD